MRSSSARPPIWAFVGLAFSLACAAVAFSPTAVASPVLSAWPDPGGTPSQVAAHTGGELPSRHSSTGATLAAQVLYPDVAATHTLRDDIVALAAQGIFDGTHCGDNLFCPDDPVDRKTMAVWVVRVLDGRDPPAGSSRFPDVNIHLPAFWPPFVERMAELGVTRGCGDGTNFCPNDPVTRTQTAVFLTRAFNLPDGPDPGFSDVGQSYWASDQIAALAASGITRGCGDGPKFCPGDPTTRAQMATFLNRAISYSHSEEDSTDQDSTGEKIVVPVYYCGPEGVYDQARLNEEVGQFNSTISSFYREQSQGAVDLRFKAGEILSPDVDWSDQAANSITAWEAARSGHCDRPTGRDQFVPGFEKSIVLAHVPPGPHALGYSRSGMAPVAVLSTVEMLELHGGYSRAVHLVTAAHELGHLLWDFNHPDEEGRTSGYDRMSLMSHSTVLELSEAYIACYQRQQQGWVDDNCDATPEDVTAPDPADGQDGTLQLVISWGGDGSDRRHLCPQGEECRNLAYRYIGDWPDPPYDMECKVDGRGGSRFTWSGRPHTGCIYRLYAGPSLTAQAVIYNVSREPVRSNVLVW